MDSTVIKIVIKKYYSKSDITKFEVEQTLPFLRMVTDVTSDLDKRFYFFQLELKRILEHFEELAKYHGID